MSQRDELEFQGGAATKPEATVERIVIMPATVGQRRKISNFSRSFGVLSKHRKES
jgi:hypothetical protein